MWVGLGQVRSFAFTLLVGVIVSLFGAFWVSRSLFETGLAAPLLTRPRPWDGERLLRWRRLALAASLTVLLAGGAAILVRGPENLGADFRGGTQATLSFQRPTPVERIRLLVPQAELQQLGPREIRVRTSRPGAERMLDSLQRQLAGQLDPAAPVSDFASIGGLMAAHQLRQGLVAMGVSLAGILAYLSVRFRTRDGLAAVLCLLHDVGIVLGVLALCGVRLSVPILAALLTVVGYSLNDTIVLFDRIRENGGRYEASVGQTLRRTLLTSSTTLGAVLCLWLAGRGASPALAESGLALTIGVVAGTSSSIFVAVPLLRWWDRTD